MRKQYLFLLLVMVLASCSPLAEDPQSPSAGTTVSATQAPTEVEAAWQTYTNAEVGFSIQYPADWQQQDLPVENAGEMHHIALQGPEGGMQLSWGVGFGGACLDGYQPIAIAQGALPACHNLREDGTDMWSLTGQPLENTGFGGFVYTNDTTAESREVVLQVLSTLSFP